MGMLYILVAIGCALGGICRYWGMTFLASRCGERFPWGTLAVNFTGSFLLGAILGAGILHAEGPLQGQQLYAFAAVGFCGGLTTFSTFSLQNLALLSEARKFKLMANLFGSVLLCMLAASAGYMLLERWAA